MTNGAASAARPAVTIKELRELWEKLKSQGAGVSADGNYIYSKKEGRFLSQKELDRRKSGC